MTTCADASRETDSRHCPESLPISDAVSFTHFVDRKDGSGSFRDYKTMTGALNAHRRVIKDAQTIRSWVRGYSDDNGRACTIADWMPGQKVYTQRRQRGA